MRAFWFLVIVMLMASAGNSRTIVAHQDIPVDMFRDLIGGDLSGFMRRSSLSKETEGMSDRLGVENLLGGSEV